MSEETKGALRIHGHVFDGEGEPVPDAMIEIWQANINGKYDHPDDTTDAELIRNFYGFRGDEVDPSDIKVIFEGGSTSNQRFTPEKFTIVGLLNNYLKECICESYLINIIV